MLVDSDRSCGHLLVSTSGHYAVAEILSFGRRVCRYFRDSRSFEVIVSSLSAPACISLFVVGAASLG